MEVEWPPVREPSAQRVWREILRPMGTQMRASASDLARRSVARMQTELPELFSDPQIVQENLVSTEASLRQLAQIIELAGDPRQVELPPSTLAIARSAVHRQVALADLMRLYRLAQERVWQWMFAHIVDKASDAADQAVALDLATGWLFAYVDEAMVRAEKAYEVEREAWLRSAAAVRAAAVEEILADRERNAQRASKRLRYDVNRHHVGAIAWVEQASEGGETQAALGEALAGLAQTLGAESTLIHSLGSLAVASWMSRRDAFTADSLDAVVRGKQVPGVIPGVRIAVGEAGRGLEGFRRTHLEADHARRVVSLVGPRGAAITRYRSVAVAALGTTDRDHALSFITWVLGPLAADDEATSRLAMTLSVYLDENRSRSRAAERLMVHPNTVSYRVHQAEALLGRSVANDSLDLQVALAMLPARPGLARPRPDEL
ncbi:helix-turn-helix domain-containing protein [Nocardia sp. NPDC004604]|uniref:PucR family transcriptional regulator n=1 Tax=Nocardia sp. NPDC004604 TaxID=3157013 RepID=UPI00339E80F5